PIRLPLRLPQECGLRDPNDPKSGRRGLNRAEGMFLLGHDMVTRDPVYDSVDDWLRHMLLLGVTGAGKTEALLGRVANAIGAGGGVIYADAKATVKLAWQIAALASLMGRIDDFLVINYITGGLAPGAAKDLGRTSNSAMPFSMGSADSILQLLVALLPGGGGGNEVFRERAIAIMGALLTAMVDLRMSTGQPISAFNIREFLDLAHFNDLVSGAHGQLSKEAKVSVTQYLSKLPGWDQKASLADQPDTVAEQFGYAQMYWTRPLGTLADTYGHIYGDEHGEVDYADVIYNRRILVTMLPAMEKAPDELGQLGKINLGALKGAMALGLGFRFEGSRAEVMDTIPTASNVPTLIVADEYGYMAAPGFAVAAAQARGLGAGVIFAGQGVAGFKVLNPGAGGEIEVGQIMDNTRTKVAMAIEDAAMTMDLFTKISGEITIHEESSFDANILGHSPSGRTSQTKQSRINLLDLRDQTYGEAHVFWKDRIIRMLFFHANPSLPERLALNRGIAVRLDRQEDVARWIAVQSEPSSGASGGPATLESLQISTADQRFGSHVSRMDSEAQDAMDFAIRFLKAIQPAGGSGRGAVGVAAKPRRESVRETPPRDAVTPVEETEPVSSAPLSIDEPILDDGEPSHGSSSPTEGPPPVVETEDLDVGADVVEVSGIAALVAPDGPVAQLAVELGLPDGADSVREALDAQDYPDPEMNRDRTTDDDQELLEIEAELRAALAGGGPAGPS
ncbi:MAG: type IV secretory system conjugative DNA transfer family protein, partial [Thermoplasmataceae archaeon]